MTFDQCPPGTAPPPDQETAVNRTLAWARRCVAAHTRPRDQSLFGIVQGGTDLALRRRWRRRADRA